MLNDTLHFRTWFLPVVLAVGCSATRPVATITDASGQGDTLLDSAGSGGASGNGGTAAASGGGGGTAAGGRGNAAGTGMAGGRGGAAGTMGAAGAGAIAAGVPYACPSPAPVEGAACPHDYLTCSYATKGCACYGKAWRCSSCPVTQPQASSDCSGEIPSRIALSCVYGSVTCSCNRNDTSVHWNCGLCPAAAPATGQACGNTSNLECRYGAASCACGEDGKWLCAPAACPANPNFSSQQSTSSCAKVGFYTCSYPDQQQDCICGPNPVGYSYFCSCPAAHPLNGSACIGSVAPCSYGDDTCTCNGSWQCKTTSCPSVRPTTGAACSVAVSSCAYGSSFCTCNGTAWTCS